MKGMIVSARCKSGFSLKDWFTVASVAMMKASSGMEVGSGGRVLPDRFSKVFITLEHWVNGSWLPPQFLQSTSDELPARVADVLSCIRTFPEYSKWSDERADTIFSCTAVGDSQAKEEVTNLIESCLGDCAWLEPDPAQLEKAEGLSQVIIKKRAAGLATLRCMLKSWEAAKTSVLIQRSSDQQSWDVVTFRPEKALFNYEVDEILLVGSDKVSSLKRDSLEKRFTMNDVTNVFEEERASREREPSLMQVEEDRSTEADEKAFELSLAMAREYRDEMQRLLRSQYVSLKRKMELGQLEGAKMSRMTADAE